MVETKRYVRNPLYVDAIRITEANFEEVSEWCQGMIANRNGIPLERTEGVITIRPLEQFIQVRVSNPKTQRQTQAFVGDWVLYTPMGYKVYTERAFHDAFTPTE